MSTREEAEAASRARLEAAQANARDRGCCAELAPNGYTLCALPAGHDGDHENHERMGRHSKWPQKLMYVVVENTPGCLPESDPVVCETIEDAVAYARELHDQLRESGWDAAVISEEGRYARFHRPDSYDPEHGAERVVEVLPTLPVRFTA